MAYLPHRSSSTARGSRAGRAMGDVDVGTGPGAALVAQVNRFTARGQYGGVTYTAVDAGLPVSTRLANTAAIIYQARLLVAQAGIPDAGTVAQLAAVNTAMASGQIATWVNANLAMVTTVIQSYADALGLPSGTATTFLGLSSQTVVLLGVVGVGAYLYFNRRGGS